METFSADSYLLTIDSVKREMQLLDDSFKPQDLTVFAGVTEVAEHDEKAVPKVVYTQQRLIKAAKIAPVNAITDNKKVTNYQKNRTLENLGALIGNTHVSEASYSMTALVAQRITDSINYNGFEAIRNTFDTRDADAQAMAATIHCAKNNMFLDALFAPSVTRVQSRDDYTAAISTKEIAFPSANVVHLTNNDSASGTTFGYKAFLDFAAMTEKMNCSRVVWLLNRKQNNDFKFENKDVFLNKDFVAYSDTRELFSTVPTDRFFPYLVNTQRDINGNVVCGLDESLMAAFNPAAFTICPWGDESFIDKVPHTANSYCLTRQIDMDIKRTSDEGVLWVIIDSLAPSLTLSNTPSQQSASAQSDIEVTVTTNTNRIKLQTWAATSDADWVHFDTSDGEGTGTLVFDLDANASGAARSATITVVATGFEGISQGLYSASGAIKPYIVKTFEVKQSAS